MWPGPAIYKLPSFGHGRSLPGSLLVMWNISCFCSSQHLPLKHLDFRLGFASWEPVRLALAMLTKLVPEVMCSQGWYTVYVMCSQEVVPQEWLTYMETSHSYPTKSLSALCSSSQTGCSCSLPHSLTPPTSTHHLPNFPCTGLKMDISFQPDSWFDTKGRVSVGLQTGSLNLNPTLTLTYHLLSLSEDRPFEWQMMIPFFCPMISPVSCYCKVSTVHPPSQFVLQTETEFSYIFKENSTWKCCQERGLVFSPPHWCGTQTPKQWP